MHIPHDTRETPDTVLWGAETARAVHNFQISKTTLPPSFIKALARIKGAWASAHAHSLAPEMQKKFAAIADAAEKIAQGEYRDQFPIDIYQTGSGTSSNMNMNEVLAALAEKALGEKVHPNDDVNRAQSSNDVFPTAMHLSCLELLHAELLPALQALRAALLQKAGEFAAIVKTGRTHLQDAVPITLGQEFGGYAAQLERAERTLVQASAQLCELPLGGTAVGTGLHAPSALVADTISFLARAYALPLVETKNHFEAQAARDAMGVFSAALRTLALALYKIANDIRWLASGPHCGLGEIALPALQAGSSIMPAKVNPVQAEMLLQVTARVIGNDACIAFAVTGGNFELNTMMPVMGCAALESLTLLARAMDSFTKNCVEGIRAHEDRCKRNAEESLSLITAITPLVGYERAAALAREAAASGKNIREILESEENFAPKSLDILSMTKRP